MDIIKILSNLQDNNIDLSQLISSISSLFNKNINTQPSQNNTQYYNLPSYNFDTKPQNCNSTMQSTMQRIVPNKTAYLSPKSHSIDFNKLAEIAQVLLPIFTSKNPQTPSPNIDCSTQKLPESQILKLAPIPPD